MAVTVPPVTMTATGNGGTLASPLRGGLRLLIRADYAASPVPRDLP